MKLPNIFFFILFLQTPVLIYSQSDKVTLNLHDTRVIDVLEEIERQTDFRFAYSSEYIDINRIISIELVGNTIQEALEAVFKESDIAFVVQDRQILLYPADMVSNKDTQQSITGTVTDNQGVPLIGVTISIVGTTQGTITDYNGNFILKQVPDDATLQFTYVGMKTVEIPVSGKKNIQVVMDELTIGLEEVVITALGIKREQKALGYSVQNVDGKVINTVKGVDIGTSLTGKVAGLLVKNNTDFAQEPTIEIRGETPILVIDGVPYENMTLRDLPSDDIENISVLKGATASALYGFRGESGAIMVTTKRKGDIKGVSVSINSSTLFTAGYLAIPRMQGKYGRTVSTETNIYTDEAIGSWGVPMEGQEVIQWDPVSKSYQPMPYLPIGKDNFQNFLELGFITNNNISVAQLGEYGSIRSSLSWVRNKGQYPNSLFDKITYTLGGEISLDKFTLSSSIAYNKQHSPNIGFRSFTGYDIMTNLLIWSSPDYDVRQYEDYWLVVNESQNSSYGSGANNPYFQQYEKTHSLDRDVFNGSITADYKFTPWLKATLRSGFDIYSDQQEVKISAGSFNNAGSSTVINGGTPIWGEKALGSYNYGLGRGFSINNDFLISASKEINDFTVDALGGGTMSYSQDDGMEALTRGGLSIPGYYSLKASIDPLYVNSRVFRRQVNSLYGRLSVSWKSILFAEGTVRNDWSSTLSEAERSYLYPSIAGSFILSEILPDWNWLSFWKLRSSWTESKRPPSIYSINTVYTIEPYAWGDLSSASFPTTIKGTDVLPESTSTFEIGTNINILKNTASVDIAYYQKRFYDFLKSAEISKTSGYAANFVNIDEEHTSEGIEISAKFTPVRKKNLQWDINLNWSKYATYYSKLDPTYSEDKPWVKVGERVDYYHYLEFSEDNEGNLIHVSGLPVYSQYLTLAGYRGPDWIWGLSTSLRYKDFTFSISADGRVGGLAQSYTEMYMWNSGNHPDSDTEERYLDATNPGTKNYLSEGVKVIAGEVTYDTYGNILTDTREYEPNDVYVTYEQYIKRIHKGTGWGGVPSPYDLYVTTYVKIRELSLTYSIPQVISSKIGVKNADLSLVAQNLFLWAKDFKYSDPDGGTENFADPSQRFVGVNLKVIF
jgi:TonB-linked SusC/RagA family outer membrane protein